jgi:DNA repair exonuclease SbcCD ATPase subunit
MLLKKSKLLDKTEESYEKPLLNCWEKKENHHLLYVFSVYIENQQELKANWKKVKNYIATYVQGLLLEKAVERWNLYIVFFVKNEIDNELKYKIEQDKFSTRKIVLDNMQKEFSEEEIMDKVEDLIFRLDIDNKLIEKEENIKSKDKKIKKITISDFRIYQGTEEFSFETSENKIADLVAIYAPNGYGKSSFFDAVQWSMTGEIERFSKSGNAKNATKSNNGFILTNMKSMEANKLGKVRIEGETITLLERKVRQRLGKDYQKGGLTKIYTINKNLTFNQAKVLSQDQIDTFVRYETPEKVYEELLTFWDDREKATEILKDINEKYKCTITEIKECKTNIKTNEDEQKKYLNSKDKIFEINQKIEKINNFDEIFDIEEIKIDNITEDDYTKITSNIEVYKDDIEKTIKNDETKIVNLEELKNDFSNYTLICNNLLQKEDEKKEYQKIKKQYLEIDRYIDAINKESLKLSNIKIKLFDYKVLNTDKKSFLLLEKNLKEILKESSDVITQKSLIQQEQLHIQKSISKEKTGKQELNKEIERLKNRLLEINKQYDLYVSGEMKFDENVIKLKEVEENFILQKNKIEELNEKITLYGNFKKNYSTIETIDEDLYNYLNLIKKLESLSRILEDKNEIYAKSGTLSKNLEKIVKWGKEHIEQTKISSCPLCNTQFDSIEILLESVKKDKEDILKLSIQEQEIKKVEDEITSIKASIKKIEDKLFKYSQKLKEILKEKQKNFNKLDISIEELKNKKNIFSKQIESVEKFFKKEFSKDIVDKNSILIIKKEEDNSLELKEKKLKEILIKIDNLEKNILEYKNNLIEIEIQIKTIQTEKEKIESKEDYKKIKNLLAKYNIENIYNNLNLLSEIGKIEANINKYEKSIEDLTKNKDNLIEKQKNNKLFLEKIELDTKLSSINEDIGKDKEEQDKFEKKFKEYVSKSTYKEEDIILTITNTKKSIDNYSKYAEFLNKLKTDLISILEIIKAKNLKKKLDELTMRKTQLDNVLSKLEPEKQEYEDYIKNELNEYFNRKTINAIYKQISPHPDYTEIDFKVSFSNSGKAQLNITAKKSNEEETINPLLYMSSGQINVLSLSIFLAKALHEKDGLDTIFIDDPVQNLSDINVLSFVDLLRILIQAPHNKQIIISTHDESFFKLMKNKMPKEYYNTKYLEFETFGKLKI